MTVLLARRSVAITSLPQPRRLGGLTRLRLTVFPGPVRALHLQLFQDVLASEMCFGRVLLK